MESLSIPTNNAHSEASDPVYKFVRMLASLQSHLFKRGYLGIDD